MKGIRKQWEPSGKTNSLDPSSQDMNAAPALQGSATWRKARSGSNKSDGPYTFAHGPNLAPATALHRLPWTFFDYFHAEQHTTATNDLRA